MDLKDKNYETLIGFTEMLADITEDDAFSLLKESMLLDRKDNLIRNYLGKHHLNDIQKKKIVNCYKCFNQTLDDIIEEMNIHK